jgi:hypothetical protein
MISIKKPVRKAINPANPPIDCEQNKNIANIKNIAIYFLKA